MTDAKCDKKSLNVMLYHEKKGVREGADPHPPEVTLPVRAWLATAACGATGTTRRPPSPNGATAASVPPLWGATSEPPVEAS